MLAWMLRLWREYILPRLWSTTPRSTAEVILDNRPAVRASDANCSTARDSGTATALRAAPYRKYIPPHTRPGYGLLATRKNAGLTDSALDESCQPSVAERLPQCTTANYDKLVKKSQRNTKQFLRCLIVDVMRKPVYRGNRDPYTIAYQYGYAPDHDLIRQLAAEARQQYGTLLVNSPYRAELMGYLAGAIQGHEAVQQYSRARGRNDIGHEACLGLLIEVRDTLSR